MTDFDASEWHRRGLNKRRSRLIVQIDLDPVPGWGNTAEDHCALVQRLLDDAVGHYKPTVQISVISQGVDR